jgi:hypothetical protein
MKRALLVVGLQFRTVQRKVSLVRMRTRIASAALAELFKHIPHSRKAWLTGASNGAYRSR